jgi:hypothetical protein
MLAMSNNRADKTANNVQDDIVTERNYMYSAKA